MKLIQVLLKSGANWCTKGADDHATAIYKEFIDPESVNGAIIEIIGITENGEIERFAAPNNEISAISTIDIERKE